MKPICSVAPVLRAALLAGLCLTASSALAQGNLGDTPPHGGISNSASQASPSAADAHDHAGIPPEISTRMAEARNDERQKRLVADTEKLLALATSLKADVDKTNRNILSVDVIRRSEEIEKLAKSIRERAKS